MHFSFSLDIIAKPFIYLRGDGLGGVKFKHLLPIINFSRHQSSFKEIFSAFIACPATEGSEKGEENWDMMSGEGLKKI